MLRLLFFVVVVVSLQAIPAHWPKYTEPTPPPPPDQAGQYGGEYAKGYVEDSVIDLLANRGIEEPENAYLVKEGSAKDIPVTVDYSIDEKPVKILN